MGRPKSVRPARTGSSRRDFFKRSGGAAVALAAVPTTMLAIGSGDVEAKPAGLFQHGVASGDPLSDRVILWTRVSPTSVNAVVVVDVVVATDVELKQVVFRGRTKTSAQRDFTVKFDATGLQPARTYYYRFNAQGTDSAIGRTRTLPVGDTQRVRMAVVSCSNHAAGYFNVYARIAQRADLDMVVHLGDYLYEYGTGQYGSLRTPEPPTEMLTLADYRMRHAQYKRDPDSQAVHRQHPFVAIWDDHEITNDSWKDGAQNHQPGTEGDWNARVRIGLQAYYEWMPVRPVDTTNPRKNNRAFNVGGLIDLILLEERLQSRSLQLPATVPAQSINPQLPAVTGFFQVGPFTDPNRTLLGAEQESWLANRLRTSSAKWKFLGQGVMFAQLKVVGTPVAPIVQSPLPAGGLFLNPDQWDGYQPARDRLYAVLKGNANTPAVNNCVVLTGDIHSSFAADLTQDPNNPIPALGGYDKTTGTGSRAVEFVGTSVTSPGFGDIPDPSNPNFTGPTAQFVASQNPHFKYVDLIKRGYLLLDATPQKVVGEYWYVDTVDSPSNIETFGIALEVQDGTNRLVASVQTTPRANPPALAP
jgi:alkaline phosphatase D